MANIIERGSKWIRKRRLDMEKHGLERRLAKIVDLVEGHKAASLPPGHVYYQRLLSEARGSIASFQSGAKELGFTAPSYEEIAMGIPSLKEIEDLAAGRVSGGLVATMTTAVPIATLILSVTVTIVYTLCQVIHYYLQHWLIR